MSQVILWDFDGTLGYREGNWEETIFELSEERIKKSTASFSLVSQMLQTGFPWHDPDKDFTGINNSEAWWGYVKPRLVEIFMALGFHKHEAETKADLVPKQYTLLSKWKLYYDVIPNLVHLQSQNRKHVLVTNNVPGFWNIINYLGIKYFFDAVFISSLTGFNKPNPLIIGGYLEKFRSDIEVIVVGDREDSDIKFAEAIGAKGILVRSNANHNHLHFDNLNDLTSYLSKNPV